MKSSVLILSIALVFGYGYSLSAQPTAETTPPPEIVVFPEISQSSRDRAKQILNGANIVFSGGRFVVMP
jgi:hypothetical protein